MNLTEFDIAPTYSFFISYIPTSFYSFLFYVLTGPNLGLHRLDLGQISHLWSDLSPAESYVHRTRTVRPELIIPMPDLYTVIIDFDSVHLFVVNNAKKMLVTTFLDGTNKREIDDRLSAGTVSAMEGVVSMVYFNKVNDKNYYCYLILKRRDSDFILIHFIHSASIVHSIMATKIKC